MKISFVVGGLPVVPVFTLEEIRDAGKRKIKVNGRDVIEDVPGLPTFSDESYWKLKCLGINPEFEDEIIKIRTEIGIPIDGFSYTEYLKEYSPITLDSNSDIAKKINQKIEKMLTEFDCDEYVTTQLKSILLANIALPTETDGREKNGISAYSILDEEDSNSQNYDTGEKALFIKITTSVKPKTIANFVKKNGDKLNTLLNNLPKSRKYDDMTERKFEILSMKKNKKSSYHKMADLWADLSQETQNIVKKKETKTDSAFGKYYRSTVVDLFHKSTKKET